jgi:hypothetical protein
MKNLITTLARRLGALSPSCKQATRLQSAMLDRELTLFERFGLRCHLVLCKWCCRYGGQIKFLRAAAHEHAQHDPQPLPQGLSLAARERIKRRLQTEKE